MKLKSVVILTIMLINLNLISFALQIDTPIKRPMDTLQRLNEVVISGSLKEVNRLQSHIPVEVFSKKFFDKNPGASLFESIQQVNGLRPQLSCAICSTGDIHINGMEGAYTMVLIDGMPVMSSLGAIYGLHGVPMGMIDRIEVIKGPASITYGSEAMGGVINIITKKVANATKLYIDMFSTSYKEHQLDLGIRGQLGKSWSFLQGVNYYNYQQPIDNNQDNFTDVTQQQRIALFLKLEQERKKDRRHEMMLRYLYEDRWGGEMTWSRRYRGGDQIYGESIYTNRLEWIGNYTLPFLKNLSFNYSYVLHDQDSKYGVTNYNAKQQILFGQFLYHFKSGPWNGVIGGSGKHLINRDDTNSLLYLPSLFAQSSHDFNERHSLLFGSRLDYHKNHGLIYTPRLSYKWNLNERTVLRLLAGSGFRVVNVFTEGHAAISGSRVLKILENLNPERSYQMNLNFLRQINVWNTGYGHLEFNLYYTHFTNRIMANLEEHPDWIVYRNLDGYGWSRGANLALDLSFIQALKLNLGVQYQDIQQVEKGQSRRPNSTENFSMNWSLSYAKNAFSLDYTGSLYSSMTLPLVSEFDPRPGVSPWWSIQNIQLKWQNNSGLELYMGIKNLLNFKPIKNIPFLIARSHDPFDKRLEYDAQGQIVRNAENPYGLSFDPGYVYAPNQGIKIFFGIRYNLSENKKN